MQKSRPRYKTVDGSFLCCESLHFLRSVHAQEGQAVLQNAAGGIRRLQPGCQHCRGLVLDAAGGVEAVEAARQLYQIAVDVAGIVVTSGQPQLLAELGDLLDEGDLRLAGEK